MAVINTLMVRLGLQTAAFDRGTRRARSSLGGLGTAAAGAQRRFMGFSRSLLAFAGIAGLGYVVKQTMESIDQIAKMSDELGISTENLAAWGHAAQISGSDIKTLHKGLGIFVRRLGEVQIGVGEALRGFEALGWEADRFKNTRPEEAFLQVAEAISQIENEQRRALVAYSFFGRQGVQLINMLLEGRVGIEALADEADRLGITFSRLDAAKVEEANDALTRLKALFQGVFIQLVIDASPYIEGLTNEIIAIGTEGEGMGAKITGALESVAVGFAKILQLADDVSVKFSELAVVFDAAADLPEKMKIGWRDFIPPVKTLMGLDWRGPIGLILDVRKKVVEGLEAGITEESVKIQNVVDKLAVDYVGSVEGFFAGVRSRQAALKTEFESRKRPGMGLADYEPDQAVVDEMEKAKRTIESLMKKIDAEIKLVGKLNKTWERSEDVIKLQIAAEEAYGIQNSKTQQVVAEYTEKLEALERAQDLEKIAQGVGDAFSQAFADIATGAKTAAEALDAMLNSIIQRVTQILIFEPLAQGIAGAVQGMFTPAVMHAGGIVGAGGNPSRPMPAYAWAGAPRMHGGFMPGEFPAILERGEAVLSRDMVSNMSGGSGRTVNINVQAIDAQGTYSFLQNNKRAIASMLQETQMMNHSLRRYER
jgi:hypothetical protein